MTRFPAAFVAWRNLSRNRFRSILAGLGILIAVVAIAALGIFGNVLSLGADDAIGNIGNQVIVTPNQDEGYQEISTRDAEAIRRAVDEATVAPIRTDRALVERGTRSSAAQVYGIDNPAAIYEAREGTLPEQHTQGAILGTELAADLQVGTGDPITVSGTTYRVIAVLAEVEAFTPVSANDAVLLPAGTVGASGYDQVVIKADSGTAATRAAEEVRAELNSREQRVSIFELSEITAEINDFFALLEKFLLGIGGISLLVAGVSILNVMLMSTVERREEIGVLRAVGVEKGDVLRMMLFEAVMLGAAGALSGMVVSVLLTVLLYLVTPIELWILLHPTNALYLGLAVAFGIVISLLSGLYPAWKAASERPVDALRE